MRLKDKVTVITGAASGIGKSIALRFASEGARIVIADINESGAQETLKNVQSLGVDAFVATTNIGKSAEVASLFEAIDKRGWPVDIMINNAGNGSKGFRPVHEVSDADWDSLIDVHLNGTFYCTREAVKTHASG